MFISDFARDQVLNEIKLPKDKYSVIPNPVSTDFSFEFKKFNHKKPVILHINGSLERKNLGRTIEALSTITCHLRIIGKISKENKQLLAKFKMDFSQASNLSNEEVVKEYMNCDIVNFPSLFEGFGMPIVEGQAVGRVVITSNIAPMNQVAGEGAMLVDPTDVTSIKKAYLKIIDDDNFRNTLIKNGLENVKKFQLKAVSAMYVDVYREIISK